jgi:hypothetical protein
MECGGSSSSSSSHERRRRRLTSPAPLHNVCEQNYNETFDELVTQMYMATSFCGPVSVVQCSVVYVHVVRLLPLHCIQDVSVGLGVFIGVFWYIA